MKINMNISFVDLAGILKNDGYSKVDIVEELVNAFCHFGKDDEKEILQEMFKHSLNLLDEGEIKEILGPWSRDKLARSIEESHSNED